MHELGDVEGKARVVRALERTLRKLALRKPADRFGEQFLLFCEIEVHQVISHGLQFYPRYLNVIKLRCRAKVSWCNHAVEWTILKGEANNFQVGVKKYFAANHSFSIGQYPAGV